MDEFFFKHYNPALGGKPLSAQIHAGTLQMNLHPLDLSIIIPAFNEERRLPKTLDRISYTLKTGKTLRN